MAAMDFSLRRDDRGMSVFWMILMMGAGVFALLALVLVLTSAEGEQTVEDAEPEIVVNEGETMVNGVGNTEAIANENDETFLGDTETVDGPTPEGDLSTEDIEVEVAPGDPTGGAVVDPAEAGTDVDAGMEQGTEEGIEAGGGGPDADQEDVVVDPDGATAPVVPTPSGPEGNDDQPLTVD